MLSILKNYKSLICILNQSKNDDRLNKNNDELIKYKLAVYFITLGYFCSKLDNNIFDINKEETKTIIKDLENKIINIIETRYLRNECYFRILSLNNNLDSFNYFINNIKKYLSEDTISNIINNFNFGYNYYKMISSDSLLDTLLLKKHERTEKKLTKILEDI